MFYVITAADVPNFPDTLHMTMGRHSYMGVNYFIGLGRVDVGNFTSIGDGIIIDPGQHPTDRLSTSPFTYMSFMGMESKHAGPWSPYRDVKIGNDVYIGHHCKIMGGVTIGDGAIVGMGAVVTHDVPPYAIVGGVPARVIKYRFAPDVIADLLRLKWWDLSDEVIADLPVCDIAACIKMLKKIRGEN